MRNVITNYQVSLLRSLQESFARAEQIKMVVSFVLESGVRLLLPDLQRAVERGVTVQILTSPYLNITEPSALYLLKDGLDSRADIRVYESGNVAFHPKTHICLGGNSGEVYVGSSNMSKSGLVDGIEWNYRLLAQEGQEDSASLSSTLTGCSPRLARWMMSGLRNTVCPGSARAGWVGVSQPDEAEKPHPRGRRSKPFTT